MSPLGYEQITSLSTVKTLTVPAGAEEALIQAETQNVRWLDTGGDPTASVGQLLAAGDSLVYKGSLKMLRFIEVTSGAKLNVTYYR